MDKARETVYFTLYDNDWPGEMTIVALAALISDAIKDVPEEFHALVMVNVKSGDEYFPPTLELTYERLETDAEMEKRIAAMQAEVAARATVAQDRQAIIQRQDVRDAMGLLDSVGLRTNWR